jgi:hypothetical protein
VVPGHPTIIRISDSKKLLGIIILCQGNHQHLLIFQPNNK